MLEILTLTAFGTVATTILTGICSSAGYDGLSGWARKLQERLKAGELPENHDMERAARLPMFSPVCL